MASLSLWSRFLLGLVQVAGFNSKREQHNVVEQQQMFFSYIRTQQVFGQRYTHVTVMMGCISILVSLNWLCVCVCVNALELLVETKGKVVILPLQVTAPTLHFISILLQSFYYGLQTVLKSFFSQN